MTKLAINNELTEEERRQFNFHSLQIQSAIKKGVEATNDVISHILAVVESNPPLWREHYESEEDYVKTELNIEMSSFWRKSKDNKNFLYLSSNTEDPNEQITLARMRPVAYRELRRLATANNNILKIGGQSDEEYRNKLKEKEEEDSLLIQELWREVYPRIVKFKEQSQTGIYTNGGYSITAKDITETCNVLQKMMEVPKLLADGLSPAEISISTIDGRDLSLQEVIDVGGDYAMEVLDAVEELGISEVLTEKLKRQKNHIKESLENKYDYDKYEGKLILKQGRLVVSNQFADYDLLEEWADLLNEETVVNIRRKRYDD